MKMSLHRALAQRKITKARLEKEIADAKFIAITIGTSGKVEGVSVEDVKKFIEGNYQKVLQLQKNLRNLSVAINEANNGITAETTNIHKVDFDGRKATLSEILVTQESIHYTKMIIDAMANQLSKAKNRIARSQVDVDERCDRFLSSMAGGDKAKLSASDIDSMSKNFHENNDNKLVDPLNLEKVIEKLRERVEFLDVETDSKISEINAMTEIEVADN